MRIFNPPHPPAPPARTIAIFTPVGVKATVELDGGPDFPHQMRDSTGYCAYTVPGQVTSGNLIILASGWKYWGHPVALPPDNHDLFAVQATEPLKAWQTQLTPPMEQEANVRPDPEPHAALGPWDPPADGCEIHFDLPENARAQIEQGPMNRRYHRGNWFGVSVPGLPFVPGGSSERPDLLMTWFLHKYNDADRRKILDTYARRGYYDYLLMLADCQHDGVATEQFLALCRLVKSYGHRVCVTMGSKTPMSPQDATVDGWPSQQAMPVLRRLIDEQLIDKCCPGFEWNLWNDPRHTHEIIDYFATACRPADVYLYMHFSSNVDWWSTDPDRRAFWRRAKNKLRGIWKQNDAFESVALQQARLNEEQVIFNELGPDDQGMYLDNVAAETCAIRQFPMYEVSEQRGDTIGWEMTCTPGAIPIMGGCNGQCWPDGRPL